MIRRVLHITLLLVLSLSLWAETQVVTLRSGRQIQGEIIVHDDQVLILRDASGARFQFPADEVVRISTPLTVDTIVHDTAHISAPSVSRVALRLCPEVAAITGPHHCWGAMAGLDLALGSRQIGDRPMFLGVSAGIHGTKLDGRTLLYIPLQVVLSAPLTQRTTFIHAPELGASIGYGFGVGNHGGICASLSLGWRYQYSNRSAMILGLESRFWQDRWTDTSYTRLSTDSYIDDSTTGSSASFSSASPPTYTATYITSLVSIGLSLKLEF